MMFFGKERQLRNEIIAVGKKLYGLRLVAAKAGNLSARLDQDNILITATGTALGSLKSKDILKIELANPRDLKNKRLSTEFPLHNLIYENFKHRVVIHCHPALVNGYFAVYSEIKPLTFETKLYLGNVPVVAQETPAVTKPELVIEALKLNNLVVLRNHGVVSVSDDFKKALYLIEELEEAVRTVALARIFKKEVLDGLDKELKVTLESEASYEMFSREHIQAIVERVNSDEFIAQKGRELDLTLKFAIRLEGNQNLYKFNFEKGKIIRLDFDNDAPFIFSGPKVGWQQIFLGKLDPFVAVTQGKMKLEGQLGQLSRWYVPFTRLFAIFREVRIK